MSPNNIIRDCVRLVSKELRIDVLKTGEVGKGKTRQTPVKRILRNAGDSQSVGNVIAERVEILRTRTAAIEVEAEAVGQLADTANITDGHIKAANARIAAHAGERIGDVGARPVIVKAESQVVAWSASSPPPSARWRGAKGVIDPHVEIVAVTGSGGHEMKILIIAGKIRQRDVVQQSCRGGIDLRNRIVRERSVRAGLKISTGCPFCGPEVYVVCEKFPCRSSSVGTVEN